MAKLLFRASLKRPKKPEKTLSKTYKPRSKVSAPNELLWALIGVLLTIFGTFIEASFTNNPPWTWAEQGIHLQSLGVTYQIGAVLLVGCLGGKNAGALSQIAYLFLGLYWLPVFAKGGGIDYIKEPTFGYLLGFVPGAWLCGFLAFRTRPRLESLAFSALGGLAVIHLVGLAYLVGLSYWNPEGSSAMPLEHLKEMAIEYSVEPLPGQLVIVCAVAVIAFILRQILFY